MHERELRPLAAPRASSILFTGPLHGEAKREALSGSDCFVLPSYSEGFPVAILEAAAYGLPVLMTDACHFPELAQAGGAIEVQPVENELETGLRRMLGFPDAERQSTGADGATLVSREYG